MSQFSTIEEMSLDGFQIVNANMFIHIPRNSDPTCTVWPTRISFNKLTLEKLNLCENTGKSQNEMPAGDAGIFFGQRQYSLD